MLRHIKYVIVVWCALHLLISARFEAYCSIPELCGQHSSYSSKKENRSFVFIPVRTAALLDGVCIHFESQSTVRPLYEFGYCAATVSRTSHHQIIQIDQWLSGIYHLSIRTFDASHTFVQFYNQLHVFREIEDSTNHLNRVDILRPVHGSLTSGNMELLITWQPNYYSYLDLLMRDQDKFALDASSDLIRSGEVEAGSWFLQLKGKRRIVHVPNPLEHHQSFDADPDATWYMEEAFPEEIYLEFVLSREEIQQQRLFVNHQASPRFDETNASPHTPGSLAKYGVQYGEIISLHMHHDLEHRLWSNAALYQTLYSSSIIPRNARSDPDTSTNKSRRIHVCIWTGNKMDGQKVIWLQQLRHMDRRRFRFSVILSQQGNPVPVHDLTILESEEYIYKHIYALAKGHEEDIRIGHSALDSRPIEDFEMREEIMLNATHNTSCAQYAQRNLTRILEFVHSRFVAANADIDDMRPLWCRDFYQLIRAQIVAEDCDMLVYGNGRAYTAEIFFLDIARHLRIPVVSELLNLYLHPELMPNVVVAPSHHSLYHASIAEPMREAATSRWSDLQSLGADKVVEYQRLMKKLDINLHAASSASVSSMQGGAVGVVIAPAVDFDLFSRQRVRSELLREKQALSSVTDRVKYDSMSDHDHSNVFRNGNSEISKRMHLPINCQVNDSDDSPASPCFHIGFVARLAAGKNPGLFLQMAWHLYQQYPLVRFTVVGDGILMSQLQDLAEQLSLQHVVHFAGWIPTSPSTSPSSSSAEEHGALQYTLPQLLSTFDLVVNPSLRGWSETFCIANLEVLSMEVPLVTFAVGGIGEYVSPLDLDNSPDSTSEEKESRGWEVKQNAVLLNVADPAVMAQAVFHLIRHPDIRQQLAHNGRQSIAKFFTVQRQMTQYAELYEAIFAAYRT